MVKGDVGPYQVVYLKNKTLMVYGKMFDTIELALNFAHKSTDRWLILQKDGHDGVDYAWKVLPYGAYDSYRTLVKLDYMRYVLIAVIFMVIVWAIFFRKKGAPVMPKF